jgi:hypothetical protein
LKTFVCEKHRIVLTLSDDGKYRKFDTPPGSWAGVPQCWLMTAKEPREGTYENCTVREKRD